MNQSERPEKLRATAFDGLAAALSPALIIGMIGSLVFFLVIAFYRGQYDARLMYILALYTAATVLVARIAIESDRARAAMFAVPLAIAAMLGMMRFVTISGDWAALSWIVNIGLLGLTYYLADRITFDCTLLEEDRESLQGGLLQTIGSSVAQAAVQPGHASKPADVTESKGKPSTQPIGAAPLKKAKHNPGVWVLYFALIAFPLFGVGQLVIPDERQRAIAFWCLVAYLGCALALLMTTSLLGMRRYLRQRGAMMPPDITAKWLVAGGLITCAILIACMLMPLPDKQLSVAGLKIELTSPDNLTTSKFGWGNDGQNEGQTGQPNEQSQGEDAQQGNAQQGNAQQGNAQQGNAQQGNAQQGNAQQGNAQQGKPEKSGSSQSEQGPSNAQNQNSAQSGDKGQQASEQGDQGQSGGKQGQANDTGGKQPGPQDRASNNQTSQTKDQRNQHEQPNNAQPNNAQPNNQENNTRNDQPNNRPNNQPNRPAQAQPKPDQAGQPPNDEPNPNPNNNQPQPAQAAPPESEPLRAGNSLSQASRSLASNLLDTLKNLGSLFKWLLIAVLAGIVIFFVLTHLDEVKRLIADLMNFINALLGRRTNSAPATESAEEPSVAGPMRRPFSAFPNPFSRSLQGWQGPQVVQHTFAALEAWAAQRGRARAVDQTAEEFARKLVAQEPELDRLPLQAASMLDRVMFAGWQPSRQEVAALEQLWDRMLAK